MKDFRILMLIAGLVILLGFGYLFAVTFWTIPAANEKQMEIIIGFVNSSITLILGYYWGSSHRTKTSPNENPDAEPEAGDETDSPDDPDLVPPLRG